MNAPTKLGAFGLVLAVALGGGAAVGRAVGPLDTADANSPEHAPHDPATSATVPSDSPDRDEDLMPAGLSMSEGGYTLIAEDAIVEAPSSAPFRFRVTGPDGAAVRDFTPRHERELHLIVVSTDLSTYAHLHPTLAADGTWSAALGDLPPATYRAFADFVVAGGPELTLGVDVAVPGDALYAPLPPPAVTTTVDGYDVTLAGSPVAGAATEVALTVERDGAAVTDLAPYLGAHGHLVAIRSGDLGYLHVHPTGAKPASERAEGGPTVRFAVEVPSPGDYRLFFDFLHGGQVRTAAFTLHVPADAAAAADGPAHGSDQGAHG